MIQSFADVATEDLFHGKESKAARTLPKTIWNVARRKLDMVNAAQGLADLKVPRGNELHALENDLVGFHGIKINTQYRVIFRFRDGHAYDVRCTDYH